MTHQQVITVIRHTSVSRTTDLYDNTSHNICVCGLMIILYKYAVQRRVEGRTGGHMGNVQRVKCNIVGRLRRLIKYHESVHRMYAH